VIRHCLFGAAHIDRIGRATGLAALGQSNPGTMREMPGGAAFNVASSLAALGASVTLFSAAGSDLSGEQVSTEATARGVDLIGLKSFPQRPTATYTAILDSNGDLITALSDMEIYDGVQLDRANPAEDDWLHVDTNFPEQILGALLTKPAAHRSAMTVSVAKANRLRPHLAKLNLLFTNRAEAAALCGFPAETPLGDLAAQLSLLGCRRAIVTDGPDPIYLLDAEAVLEIHVPATEVKSVTGAGDALTATTLFALGAGRPLKDAVQLGIGAARAILAVDGPYRADLAQAIGVSS